MGFTEILCVKCSAQGLALPVLPINNRCCCKINSVEIWRQRGRCFLWRRTTQKELNCEGVANPRPWRGKGDFTVGVGQLCGRIQTINPLQLRFTHTKNQRAVMIWDIPLCDLVILLDFSFSLQEKEWTVPSVTWKNCQPQGELRPREQGLAWCRISEVFWTDSVT